MNARPASKKDRFAKLIGAELNRHKDVTRLARASKYSRFHFQRVFKAATGETPGRCRRRLLLERAGHRLLHSQDSVTHIAFEADFESHEGFSRAFKKAYAASPKAFRESDRISWFLAAPNDIHYDPVLGAALLTQPHSTQTQGETVDVTERLLEHDYWHLRRILAKAEALTETQLDAPLVEPIQPLPFEEAQRTLRELLHKTVFTVEVWMAAVHGRKMPEPLDMSVQTMSKRAEATYGEFLPLVRRVRRENLWDTAFLDMLCKPPESFSYGGMISHILTYTSYRRLVTVSILKRLDLYDEDVGRGDPLDWERTQ